MNSETSQPPPAPEDNDPQKQADLEKSIALIERIHRRDEAALDELYDWLGNRIYSLALYILRNPLSAEEVTQDVLLKIWRQPDTWQPEKGSLATWLLAIAKNAAIDRTRKQDRQPAIIDVPLDKVMPLHQPKDKEWQQGQQLRVVLQGLPPEQAQVIKLSYFGGMSQSDIADTLGLPLGTVKTRMRLGMQKLRAAWLDGKGSDDDADRL